MKIKTPKKTVEAANQLAANQSSPTPLNNPGNLAVDANKKTVKKLSKKKVDAAEDISDLSAEGASTNNASGTQNNPSEASNPDFSQWYAQASSVVSTDSSNSSSVLGSTSGADSSLGDGGINLSTLGWVALGLVGVGGIVALASSGGGGGSSSTSGDSSAPTLKSIAAHSENKSIVLTYNEALDGSHLPALGSFIITTNGVVNTVTSISISGNVMTLTLANAFTAGALTIAYKDPSEGNDANAIQDATGNDAASLPAHAVTNNSPDVTPPVFASAAVNGSTLVLSYTDANLLSSNAASANAFAVLSNGNANAVTAVSVDTNAKTVTLTLTNPVVEGDTVTVAYTDPTANKDSNAIQENAGNDAESLPAHAVTNTTTPDKTPKITTEKVNK